MASSAHSNNSNNATISNNINSASNGFNFASSMNQIFDFNAKIENEFEDDNLEEESNNLIDLLGLDDWKQMLDEDYISRLTADFNMTTSPSNNSNNNKQPLVSSPIASTASSIIQPQTANINAKQSVTTIATNKNNSMMMPTIQHITNTKTQPKQNQPLVLLVPQQQNQNQSSLSQVSPFTKSSNIKKISIQAENTSLLNGNGSTTTKIISNATANVVRRLSSVMLNENNTNNNSQNQSNMLLTASTASKPSQPITSIISSKTNNVSHFA